MRSLRVLNMPTELVYGLKPVLEALRGQRRAFELFVITDDQKDHRLEKVLALATERGIPVRRRQRADLAQLTGTDHHQGIALRMEPFSYAELEDVLASCHAAGQDGLLVVLDSIQDPHNLGAIIRTAACAGVQGVIIPKDKAAQVTATVEKVSAGAVETVPIVQVTNIAQTLERLKDEGFWMYGAAGEAGTSIYRQDFRGRVAIVIGGEGEGLRPLIKRQCDHLVAIPLVGGVASLNASVAAGIILFEVVRQRAAV